MNNFFVQNNREDDFRPVVRAAEILENSEMDNDQVIILPRGPSRRAYAKQINNHSVYYSESKLKECLLILSNEDGLYDMLPEGLFHQSPVRSSIFSEEEMIDDIRLSRQEEKDARKFFSPFEAEINYVKTLLQWYENRLDKSSYYRDLTNMFAAEWDEFLLFDQQQSLIWMHLLPSIKQKRNDLFFLGQLLSLLFRIPVETSYSKSEVKHIIVDKSLQYNLGDGLLGSDTIIGSGFIAEHEEVLIYIGPAKSDQLIKFTSGQSAVKIIELSASHLLPFGTDFRIELRFGQEDHIAELGNDSCHSVLGSSAYL